jgi:hypothetical protein
MKAASGEAASSVNQVVADSTAKKGTSANAAYLPFALEFIVAYGTDGGRKWYESSLSPFLLPFLPVSKSVCEEKEEHDG